MLMLLIITVGDMLHQLKLILLMIFIIHIIILDITENLNIYFSK